MRLYQPHRRPERSCIVLEVTWLVWSGGWAGCSGTELSPHADTLILIEDNRGNPRKQTFEAGLLAGLHFKGLG